VDNQYFLFYSTMYEWLYIIVFQIKMLNVACHGKQIKYNKVLKCWSTFIIFKHGLWYSFLKIKWLNTNWHPYEYMVSID